MSAPRHAEQNEQTCIQDKIRHWYSNLETEYRSLMILVVVIVFISSVFKLFLSTIYPNYLSEFVAGALGILLAFNLDRIVELRKKNKVSKQIIDNLLVELMSNEDKIKIIRSKRFVSHFELFQTTIWDMFNTRMEFDNIEILFDLGILYHKFVIFNSMMKLQDPDREELTIYIMRNPNFLEHIESKINDLIIRLKNI